MPPSTGKTEVTTEQVSPRKRRFYASLVTQMSQWWDGMGGNWEINQAESIKNQSKTVKNIQKTSNTMQNHQKTTQHGTKQPHEASKNQSKWGSNEHAKNHSKPRNDSGVRSLVVLIFVSADAGFGNGSILYMQIYY